MLIFLCILCSTLVLVTQYCLVSCLCSCFWGCCVSSVPKDPTGLSGGNPSEGSARLWWDFAQLYKNKISVLYPFSVVTKTKNPKWSTRDRCKSVSCFYKLSVAMWLAWVPRFTFRMMYTNVHLVNVAFRECYSVKHVVMTEFFFFPLRREALGTGLQLHVGQIVEYLKTLQSLAFIFPRGGHREIYFWLRFPV